MTEPFRVDLDGTRGQFWIPGSLSTTGSIFIAENYLQVKLDGILQPSRSLRRKITKHFISTEFGGNPKDLVSDYNPISIYCNLDDGRLITLLDARAEDNFQTFDKQSFKATRVLVGTHASANDTMFQAVRVSVPGAQYWPGLFAGNDDVEISMEGLRGKLKAAFDDGVGWLEMSMIDGCGLDLQELDRRYWNRFFTLLKLWTNVEISQDKRIQLRVEPSDNWAELVSFCIASQVTQFYPHKSLLQTQNLTLQVVTKALSMFDKLAPIPDIASRDTEYSMTIESAVLVNASSLEGLHRRCYEKSKPFPTVSNRQAEKIASKAAHAAALEAIELGAIESASKDQAVNQFMDSISFFNQQTFGKRLEELLPLVESVAPGLTGNDRSKWIRSVVEARNLEAHRFPKDVPNYHERTDHYIQLAMSTGWVLRISILLQLGVQADILSSRLQEHEKFLFALANMDNCRFPWPGSRFDSFKKSRVTIEATNE
jgi:hypothetical protein